MTTIAVIGAGTMGHGIAESFAIYNYNVNLFDISTETLDNALIHIRSELSLLAEENIIDINNIDNILENITLYNSLQEAVKNADYVIESVIEKLEVKQEIFNKLDLFCKDSAILSTNTSSFKLSEIIKGLSNNRKANCIITHFYNPSHIIPLVEVSSFGETSQNTYEKVAELYNGIGKQVAKVLKEVPGLLANRIQQAVAREVFSLIQLDVAAPEDIDKALKFGPAFRYCSTGQLEIADFGGIDIWKIVGDNLLPDMDNSKIANPLLSEKVNSGKLGIKSGEGFYKYNPETISDVKTNYMRKLITQLKISKNYI